MKHPNNIQQQKSFEFARNGKYMLLAEDVSVKTFVAYSSVPRDNY